MEGDSHLFIPKSGSKRKLSARENGGRNSDNAKELDDFQFTRLDDASGQAINEVKRVEHDRTVEKTVSKPNSRSRKSNTNSRRVLGPSMAP